jgi:hypothetical protein
MMHSCMVGGVYDVCLWRWCMIHECMVCKFGSECMSMSVYECMSAWVHGCMLYAVWG